MDSISDSCIDLNKDKLPNVLSMNDVEDDENFSKILGSCLSISRYEKRNFKNLIPQIIAALSTASLHIAVGMSIAYAAILIPQLQENDEHIKITSNDISWIASVIQLAAPIGTITAGFLMDFIGRLNTVRLGIIPGIFGWILIGIAKNLTMLLSGRILVGLSTALGTTPIVVYITEIARNDMRGSLISLAPTLTSLGMMIAYTEGWFLHWRTVAYTTIIFLLIPLILINFIPDSPLWLISKGRYDEARKSLEWINKYQPQPENRDATFALLQLTLLKRDNEQKQKTNKTINLKLRLKEFLKPTGYKPLILLICLFIFQQFSGIFIVIFYSTIIFKETGTSINPYLASILIGLIRFIMSLSNTFIMKRHYKRPLILISSIGMITSISLSGLFTLIIKKQLVNDGTMEFIKWLPVICLLIFILSTMIGVGPIPVTMMAELFPIEIRGIACSIVRSCNNLLIFTSVKIYPNLLQLFHGIIGLQWFFACISLIGFVFYLVFLPETYGKKLSEIENYFRNNTIYYKPNCCKKSEEETKRIDESDCEI